MTTAPATVEDGLQVVDAQLKAARAALLEAAEVIAAMEDLPGAKFRTTLSDRIHRSLAASLAASAEATAAAKLHALRSAVIPGHKL